MRRLLLLVLLVTVLAAGGLTALPGRSVAGIGSPVETVWLDTYADADASAGDPAPIALSAQSLEQGRTYLLVVSGTFSVWMPGDWTQQGATGPAEPSPMYPSPGTANGMVGWDADFAFAHPTGYLDWVLPAHQSALRISLDGGTAWSHVEPTMAGYRADHTYGYAVVGQGSPLGLWLDDGNFRDNYGVLRCDIIDPEGSPAHIVVQKLVSPADAPAATFTFVPSWGDAFVVAAGGSADSGPLSPGIYAVSELLPEDWRLASALCDDGSNPAAIGLSPGETVTCVFTDAYEAPLLCDGREATLVGTAGADLLVGTDGPDVIAGLGGDDLIAGRGGDDRLCGGAGADRILGGEGRDRIRGGPGGDTLAGGAGRDWLRGGPAGDSADGGAGSDSCWAEAMTDCE